MPAGFSPFPVRCRPAWGPRPCVSCAGIGPGGFVSRWGRVHFPWVESHDRFRGGHEPAGEGRCRVGFYPSGLLQLQRDLAPAPGTEEPPRPGHRRVGTAGEAETGMPSRVGHVRAGLAERATGANLCGSVATPSALHPTRLETRTKESGVRASQGVVRNPRAQ